MPDIDLASRLAGGMLGLLVGDTLGVPYEFLPPGAIGTVEFRGHGTHGKSAGTWSDDGALAFALADSLLPATGTTDPRAVQFDPDDQGRRIVAWWREPAYTPNWREQRCAPRTRSQDEGRGRRRPRTGALSRVAPGREH
jgi:ADP-ribosyl-[dinitrogen reductase] hydrolase